MSSEGDIGRALKPRWRSETLAVWGNTRMVVLTAISASLYAALLIPFKLLPLIPGVTELRPGNAIPVVCSLLFGPAAAWGAGIGNLIGDFFGGFGPGAIFGFLGNFIYGLLPYKIWRALQVGDPVPRSAATWILFTGVVALAAAGCALSVGWGLNLLGFVPFAALANIIFVNNFFVSALLAPLLLRAIYPRVKRAGLCYEDVQAQRPASGPMRRWLGVGLVALASIGGIVVGDLVAAGGLSFGALEELGIDHRHQISIVVLPFVGVLLLGLALL
jgi:energy-coupling factor transport system substrate-specific component